MSDFERKTLRDLIADQRSSGVSDDQIRIIVYDYAFGNFNPADKGEVDRVLQSEGISPLSDNDPRLPARP